MYFYFYHTNSLLFVHVFIDIGTTVKVGVKKVNACDCNHTVITNCFTLWLLVIMTVL